MTDKKTGNENYGGGVRQKQDNSHQPNTREQRGGYQPPSGTGDSPINPPGKK
ncbi:MULTISPECIES: hypothetical protein [Aeromonas]|uniref:hypothetical protein n=1 Tax=Aeromonas cavernicola TaxID=1006623 RepID=UPI0012FDE22F|nr:MULTISPECIES: hypothetical protein [Aeromonas]WAF94601.1 hypothetical protein NUT31_19980 [Aeromonas sp. BC14]